MLGLMAGEIKVIPADVIFLAGFPVHTYQPIAGLGPMTVRIGLAPNPSHVVLGSGLRTRHVDCNPIIPCVHGDSLSCSRLPRGLLVSTKTCVHSITSHTTSLVPAIFIV